MKKIQLDCSRSYLITKEKGWNSFTTSTKNPALVDSEGQPLANVKVAFPVGIKEGDASSEGWNNLNTQRRGYWAVTQAAQVDQTPRTFTFTGLEVEFGPISKVVARVFSSEDDASNPAKTAWSITGGETKVIQGNAGGKKNTEELVLEGKLNAGILEISFRNADKSYNNFAVANYIILELQTATVEEPIEEPIDEGNDTTDPIEEPIDETTEEGKTGGGMAPGFPTYTVLAPKIEPSFATLDESKWLHDKENNQGDVFVENGRLRIKAPQGMTLWYNEKISGDYMISLDIKDLGPDIPNDFNFYFQANVGASGNKNPWDALGEGSMYDKYSMYYLSIGGNNNTTTRFRRYAGNSNATRDMIKEYTDAAHMLKSNTTYNVKLIKIGKWVQVKVNNEIWGEYEDKTPHPDGYFAFRTKTSNLEISNLKVYDLKSDVTDVDEPDLPGGGGVVIGSTVTMDNIQSDYTVYQVNQDITFNYDGPKANSHNWYLYKHNSIEKLDLLAQSNEQNPVFKVNELCHLSVLLILNFKEGAKAIFKPVAATVIPKVDDGPTFNVGSKNSFTEADFQGKNTIYLEGSTGSTISFNGIRPKTPKMFVFKSVKTTAAKTGLAIKNCENIYFNGFGTPKKKSEIAISGTRTSRGVEFSNLRRNLHVFGFKITNASDVGIKGMDTYGDINLSTWTTHEERNRQTLNNPFSVHLYDCEVINSGNEGMYAGETQGWRANPTNKSIPAYGRYPAIQEWKIFRNYIARSGWDAIQISASTRFTEVYRNQLDDNCTKKSGSHGAVFSMNENSAGYIMWNKGKGNKSRFVTAKNLRPLVVAFNEFPDISDNGVESGHSLSFYAGFNWSEPPASEFLNADIYFFNNTIDKGRGNFWAGGGKKLGTYMAKNNVFIGENSGSNTFKAGGSYSRDEVSHNKAVSRNDRNAINSLGFEDYDKDNFQIKADSQLAKAGTSLIGTIPIQIWADLNGNVLTADDNWPIGSRAILGEITPVEEPKPDPVEPDPVEPDPIEPDPVEPDPVEPDPVEPDPVEPDPVDPGKTETRLVWVYKIWDETDSNWLEVQVDDLQKIDANIDPTGAEHVLKADSLTIVHDWRTTSDPAYFATIDPYDLEEGRLEIPAGVRYLEPNGTLKVYQG